MRVRCCCENRALTDRARTPVPHFAASLAAFSPPRLIGRFAAAPPDLRGDESLPVPLLWRTDWPGWLLPFRQIAVARRDWDKGRRRGLFSLQGREDPFTHQPRVIRANAGSSQPAATPPAYLRLGLPGRRRIATAQTYT